MFKNKKQPSLGDEQIWDISLFQTRLGKTSWITQGYSCEGLQSMHSESRSRRIMTLRPQKSRARDVNQWQISCPACQGPRFDSQQCSRWQETSLLVRPERRTVLAQWLAPKLSLKVKLPFLWQQFRTMLPKQSNTNSVGAKDLLLHSTA